MSSWISELPSNLQAKISALIAAQPSCQDILEELHDHLTGTKKRKVAPPRKHKPRELPSTGTDKPTNPHHVKYTAPVNPQEIIFSLSSLSFTSPIRRKYDLLFHLLITPDNVPHPVLSIVNATSKIPELSLTNLKSAVKLCMLAPILGNSNVSSKKDTAMLCLWLNENAAFDSKNDPIICVFSLDVIKKQLVQDGKIPPSADSELDEPDNEGDAIKPINEQIVFFLQRQFSLCGIELHNFMPLSRPLHNTLMANADSAIAISTKGNNICDFVAASAYKGSKEGSLLFINTSEETAFMVFGFKKPILLMEFSTIRDISYKDITRFTFNLVVTIANPQNAEDDEVIEFSMIDQQSYQTIDDFVRRMKIQDNSFDAKFREKQEEKAEGNVVEEAVPEAVNGDSDDEEEDGTYVGGVEEGDEDAGDMGESDSDGDDSAGSEDDDESDGSLDSITEVPENEEE